MQTTAKAIIERVITNYNLSGSTDLELMEIIERGTSARRVLAQRVNARLDDFTKELDLRAHDQKLAIQLVIAHKNEQKLPIVQKQIDRVIEHMETQLDLLLNEKDKIQYKRMSENDYCGPIGS